LDLFPVEELEKLGSRPLYRFAVETDIDGSLAAITFVVLHGEMPILTWRIPLDEAVSRLSALWIEGTEGVDLPAPAVRIAGAENTDKSAGA
jgi:hypothetical protein